MNIQRIHRRLVILAASFATFPFSNASYGQSGPTFDNATLNTPTINNGTATGTDISAAMSSPTGAAVPPLTPPSPTLQKKGRALSERLDEEIRIKDYNVITSTGTNLGAVTLDGSTGDQNRIQNFYDALQPDSLVHIPPGNHWSGQITTPQANKHVTWVFEGVMPDTPAGDGDISITLKDGLTARKRMLNTSAFQNYPVNAWLWNADANFKGPESNNYQQYSAVLARAIAGPTSTGNTSPFVAAMDSYGLQPSTSYDVVADIVINKYGQNSTWGIVSQITDLSAKAPGAQASWNEFDIWANGQDVITHDPSYGKVQAGHRSFFELNGSHLKHSTRASLIAQGGSALNVTAPNYCQTCLPRLKMIRVTATDGNDYVWYGVKTGTMGTGDMSFPAPAKFQASYSNSVLNVTQMISGTIGTNDIVTGEVPVVPVHILSQIDGTAGGIGHYQLESDPHNAANQPVHAMYSAPDQPDGDPDTGTVWRFGTEYFSTIQSVMMVTASAGDNEKGDSYGVIIGMNSTVNITDAVIDSSSATFNSDAAVIRMAPNQVIDLTSANSVATRNTHTFGFDSATNSLQYAVAGGHAGKRIFANGMETKSVSDGVAAAGTDLVSATALDESEVQVITQGTGGVKLNTAVATGGAGKQQTVYNETENAINVYPMNTSWGIWNKGNGNPYPVPAWTAATFTNINRFNNHIVVK